MVRLQKLLNFGARVISGRRKYDHISDVLKDLEWLTAANLYPVPFDGFVKSNVVHRLPRVSVQ